MKPHYKCIMLVLSSLDTDKIPAHLQPHYPKLKQLWQHYAQLHPSVLVLYVYGGGYVGGSAADLVYPQVVETNFPGMVEKTLLAMEHIDQHYSYDYLIRTNLSTFWDFNKLVPRLRLLPKFGCLTGTPINISKQYPTWTAGFDLTLSPDLVRVLLEYKHLVPKFTVYWNAEDLVFSHALWRFAGAKPLPYTKHNSCYALNAEHISTTTPIPHKYDHFRCKLIDRSQEIPLISRLITEVYNKKVEIA